MEQDFKNIKGKVLDCIKPQYLSGAGKTWELIKQSNSLITPIKKDYS